MFSDLFTALLEFKRELRGRVALTPELRVAGGPVNGSRLEKEGSTWKGSPLGGFLELINGKV